MGKLERLAAARERVRRWKREHPKSVEWQRERRYARQKAQRRQSNIEEIKRVTKTEPRQYECYGETERGDIEGVDTPYAQMEPNKKGGQGRVFTGMGQAGERGVGPKDGRGSDQETANERRTYAALERFKAKRAVLEGPGVQIEVVV
jgi:hypothetical protein